jgi:glycosyltransferase involved in cell wall biosynthesis
LREARARNTGVTSATGEYVAFLDDDDEWLPEKLERQVDLLDSSVPIVGAVYTGFIRIEHATGKSLSQWIPTKRGRIFEDMLVQNWVGTPSTVVMRKTCFQKVGLFDESIAVGLDYDMWLRIAREFQWDLITDPLVHYYVHPNKLSTNFELMIKGIEAINRKYERLFASDRQSYSARYHNLGVLYCLAGNLQKGRGAFLKALILYPFDPRYYFRLLLSLLGAQKFRKGSELREKLSAWV